ncbi:hypothetical protein EUX98_g377 [Antrodiella citrinella]|uniref:Uncharacterized protein n=1 Tax=Antrodiella citrinella TaxID=2447956 RepID=A0A4S4N5U1_9APHY|nr:hypothetical protein EUX98_g377 [Antrodiella citrinella]
MSYPPIIYPIVGASETLPREDDASRGFPAPLEDAPQTQEATLRAVDFLKNICNNATGSVADLQDIQVGRITIADAQSISWVVVPAIPATPGYDAIVSHTPEQSVPEMSSPQGSEISLNDVNLITQEHVSCSKDGVDIANDFAAPCLTSYETDDIDVDATDNEENEESCISSQLLPLVTDKPPVAYAEEDLQAAPLAVDLLSPSDPPESNLTDVIEDSPSQWDAGSLDTTHTVEDLSHSLDATIFSIKNPSYQLADTTSPRPKDINNNDKDWSMDCEISETRATPEVDLISEDIPGDNVPSEILYILSPSLSSRNGDDFPLSLTAPGAAGVGDLSEATDFASTGDIVTMSTTTSRPKAADLMLPCATMDGVEVTIESEFKPTGDLETAPHGTLQLNLSPSRSGPADSISFGNAVFPEEPMSQNMASTSIQVADAGGFCEVTDLASTEDITTFSTTPEETADRMLPSRTMDGEAMPTDSDSELADDLDSAPLDALQLNLSGPAEPTSQIMVSISTPAADAGDLCEATEFDGTENVAMLLTTSADENANPVLSVAPMDDSDATTQLVPESTEDIGLVQPDDTLQRDLSACISEPIDAILPELLTGQDEPTPQGVIPSFLTCDIKESYEDTQVEEEDEDELAALQLSQVLSSSPLPSSSPPRIFSSSPTKWDEPSSPPTSSPPDCDDTKYLLAEDDKEASMVTPEVDVEAAADSDLLCSQDAKVEIPPDEMAVDSVKTVVKRAKLDTPLSSPPRPPNPKRPTFASQDKQYKKLATVFRSPLIADGSPLMRKDGVYSSAQSNGSPVSRTPRSNNVDVQTQLKDEKADMNPASKDYTANAAKQFKSPLVLQLSDKVQAPSDSSSSVAPVHSASTMQSLMAQVQKLKQAIKIRKESDGKVDNLDELVKKWKRVGREVAWEVWGYVKDIEPEVGGGLSAPSAFGERKRGYDSAWGEGGDAKRVKHEHWGWDRDDGKEGSKEVEDDPMNADVEEVPSVEHSLGTMLRYMGIAPETLGWNDAEGDFVGEV